MGDEPEAAYRQLRVRPAPETHASCAGERTRSGRWWIFGISVAFRSISSWEDGLEPPGGQEERLPHCRSTPQPPPNETLETGLFFPGPFSPPLLSFPPMLVGILIKVLGFSKFCNKLDVPERCTGYSIFILSAQNWGSPPVV